MKIYVFYTSITFGKDKITGGTRRFLELIYGLLDKGDKIHLFVPQNAAIKEHSNLIRYNVYAFNSKVVANGVLNFIFNYNKLLSINKIDYDQLIVVGLPYALQCSLLNLKNIIFIIWEDFIGYRIISFEQKKLPKYFKNSFLLIYTTLINQLEKFSLLKASKIVVQCEYDKKIHLDRHSIIQDKLKNKFYVLFNNVNPSWILDQNWDTFQRNKYKNEYTKICFLGNIDDIRKGLHILLDAIEKLLASNYKIELNIIGGGGLLDLYKGRYKNYKEIHFIGSLINPIPELLKNDLIVVPSLADSFPNTVMESLFYGLPVIGSNRGGIPEMLKYEELIFNIEGDSLYKKLKEIFDLDLLPYYKELGKKRKVDLTFDWVEGMKSIFDS